MAMALKGLLLAAFLAATVAASLWVLPGYAQVWDVQTVDAKSGFGAVTTLGSNDNPDVAYCTLDPGQTCLLQSDLMYAGFNELVPSAITPSAVPTLAAMSTQSVAPTLTPTPTTSATPIASSTPSPSAVELPAWVALPLAIGSTLLMLLLVTAFDRKSCH